MPETPDLDLPYPPPTGVAPDVPYYMQQLAEAVESAFAQTLGDALRQIHLNLSVAGAGGNITTDANGYITVLHEAPFTPTAAFGLPLAAATTTGILIAADTFTSTTCRLRFGTWNTDAVLASGSIGSAFGLLLVR